MWKLLENETHEIKKVRFAQDVDEIVKDLTLNISKRRAIKSLIYYWATDAYKNSEYDFLLHVDGRRAGDGRDYRASSRWKALGFCLRWTT